MSSLCIVPTTIGEARTFVKRHHRHHPPPVSALFAIAVADEAGEVVGVATVGRPVARMNQDGFTAEVTRVCTLGAKNACSMLYAACWRAARAMGYRRLITYTLPSESGGSLRGAGWQLVGKTANEAGWSRPSRPRVDRSPIGQKMIWEAR